MGCFDHLEYVVVVIEYIVVAGDDGRDKMLMEFVGLEYGVMRWCYPL